ncbi:hypothetical protein [Austwickia chelonae]|nr:hypothetical protein [Austwickia chelonae]
MDANTPTWAHDLGLGHPPRRAQVVGIAGASGGIGTSCLAAALATRAATDHRVACLDADPHRGGIDVLFDRERRPGIRWPDLVHARGRLDGDALARLLPRSDEGVLLLSSGGDPHDIAPETIAATLTALRTDLDLLVLDLGVVGHPAPQATALCDDIILLVGCSVPALARAAHAADTLERGLATDDPTRTWLAQRAPRGRADLPEEIATHLDLPLITGIIDDPGLDNALGRGITPGSRRSRLTRAADRILDRLHDQARAA